MFLKSVTLEHFWGFPATFTVNISDFTALVGPNNGGKTTVLRAIKFTTDALRLYFGDGEEPIYGHMNSNWVGPSPRVIGRLGVKDSTQFFFDRSRRAESRVSLAFQDEAGVVTVTATCLTSSNEIRLSVTLDGKELRGSLGQPDMQALLDRLYETEVYFVPPLGTLSPSEHLMSMPRLRQALAEGKHAETWRNQLHWLNQGRTPDAFQRVVKDVSNYLSGVVVNPPKLTEQDDPPLVVVHYSEFGTEHDISAAGGGLRTLLTLATALELSAASILLFDEPDAHLHSSVQRQVVRFLLERAGPNRQIIVSTHAPDVIDEAPVQSLVWIDRTKGQGESCDDVGRILVELGAVSHSQAIQSLGADVVLYFEGKPDRNSLTAVMRRCGKDDLVRRTRPALLKGFGDIANLPGALRVLKALLPLKVAVAVIRDADYTQLRPTAIVDDKEDILILQLPCKELENLVLLSADTITKASKTVAEARAIATGQPMSAPSCDEVEHKIAEFSQAPDVRSAIEDQWLFRWLNVSGGLTDPGQIGKAKQAFEQHWQHLEWRRRCCPGKLMLTHLRRWLQSDPWKLTLTLPQLFEAYQPESDVQELFDKLDEYVKRVTAG